MAPETLRAGLADARSDLYSLGCVLFECLTGEPPFTGPTQASVIFGHLEESAPRVSERRAGLPHALDAVLARALDKDPGHRYASGAELMAAARAALAGRAPARGRRRRVVAGMVALAAAAAGAVALLAGSGDTPSAAPIEGDAVAAIDPEQGALTAKVPLEGAPEGIASGAGAVWVTDRDRNLVSRVDPETRSIRQTIPVGNAPSAIAAESHGVWVANGPDGTVSLISPRTNEHLLRIPVGSQVDGLCAEGGAIWVAAPLEYAVVRLDPRSRRRTGKVTLDSQPGKLACGDGVVWASSPSTGTVTPIDAASSTATQPVEMSRGVAALAVGDGAVWVANPLEGTVSRIDRQRRVVTATVAVGRDDGPASIATTPGAVWVANEFAGTLARIDPERAVVAERRSVGGRPQAVTAVDGTLWLGVADSGAGRRGGTVSLGLISGFLRKDLDFAISYGVGHDLTNDGLVGYVRQGGIPTLAADLAEALPVPSDGGRTYAFRLRPGIRYSTGEPVRPSDVRFVIERGMRSGGFAVQVFSAIRGARSCRPRACDLSRGIVADDEAGTVVFHLTEPDGDLLYKLATPFAFLLPRSVGMKVPADRLLPATGPYRIVRFDKRHEVRMERNPQFESWSPAVQPDGYPDVVVTRWPVRAREAAERVGSGELDICPRRRQSDLDAAPRDPPHAPRAAAHLALAHHHLVQPQHEGRPVRRAGRPQGGGVRARPPGAGPRAQRRRRRAPELPAPAARLRRVPPVLPVHGLGDRLRPSRPRDGTKAREAVGDARSTSWSSPWPASLDRGEPGVMVRVLRRIGYDASLRVLPDPRYFKTVADTDAHVQDPRGRLDRRLPVPDDLLRLLRLRVHPQRHAHQPQPVAVLRPRDGSAHGRGEAAPAHRSDPGAGPVGARRATARRPGAARGRLQLLPRRSRGRADRQLPVQLGPGAGPARRVLGPLRTARGPRSTRTSCLASGSSSALCSSRTSAGRRSPEGASLRFFRNPIARTGFSAA